MRHRLFFVVGLSALAAVVGSGSLDAQSGPYAKIGEIKIGGPRVSFDYLAVDVDNRRLYLTNNGNVNGTASGRVVVIDVDKNAVVGEIPDTLRVHGVAFTPFGTGFTSNGGTNDATIFDLKTLAVQKKVPIGPGPDAILYEPKMKEIYGFNHAAGTATVVKADTGAMVATIKLSGGAIETGQADPSMSRVFVNIEATSMVDAIDVNTHQVVATWPVAPAATPTGMAIDLADHLIFVGGGPNTVAIDYRTGKVVASMPICNGSDATFFDPATKYVFSSCSDGKITIGHLDSPTKLTVVQTLETTRSARTMTLDLKTHKIYVAGQDYGAADPSKKGGPPAVPDSFKVIVFGMK